MAEHITQSERGLKHISFLRRVFLKKMSGQLQVQFADGKKQQLCFHQGNFIGNSREITPVLKKFLATAVLKFRWKEEKPDVENEKISGWIAPWIALADALRGLEIDNDRLIVYRLTFSNLPPMVLKNCPVHRFDFEDEDSYRLLYQLSLGAASFEPKTFFAGQTAKEALNKRVRTVLLVFLLGFLRPISKKEKNKKNSVVARILKRFKAKGAA
ncbi:MAG: hypothetical protein Q9M11_04960 [Mariprofundaceae bacterium]|nr:hypothetical protein [Mariprofundaceae bacterium]